MAALDKYHHLVRNALEKDGWHITHDPLRLRVENRNIKIDLAAEKLIGAEKQGKKIAVEVKSFTGLSVLTDFYAAIGQCLYYQTALETEDPDRILFLAVPRDTYENFFSESLSSLTLNRTQIKVVVYNIDTQSLDQWIK